MPWCAFSIDSPRMGVFRCSWDLGIGVRVRLWKVSVYGRLPIRSFLKEMAGTSDWCPLTGGVRLREVSASGVPLYIFIKNRFFDRFRGLGGGWGGGGGGGGQVWPKSSMAATVGVRDPGREGGGGHSHMKRSGMLVVPPWDHNFESWCRLNADTAPLRGRMPVKGTSATK